MIRAHHSLAALILLFAASCGSVHSMEDPGEPIALVTARLDVAPPNLGQTGPLRAALVWTNGLGFAMLFTPGQCNEPVPDDATRYQLCEEKLRQQVQITTSDVEVEMEFPLTVTLAMYDLPTPIVQHIDGADQKVIAPDGSEQPLTGDYYSLPEAEVVLYEDGNGNGQLDLLPVGQPGPGPDHVVALSSGMDENGDAVRSAIVYKAGPLVPFVAAFQWVNYQDLEQQTPSFRPNGIYAFRGAIGPENEIAQRRLLTRHALASNDWGLADEYREVEVTPAAQSTVELFLVSDARPSWLSRGCQRFISLNSLFTATAPPAGADVLCGAGALAFSSNPDNYCGQSEIIYGSPQPEWWPCDANGLKAGTPYQVATQRLDGDPTSYASLAALGFGQALMNGLNWQCRKGVVYHFDTLQLFSMPSAAPAAGSQVMCHSADSFSHIPPRADGCLFKYRTYLASDPTWPNGGAQMLQWDMRANPPAWWPCDANGQLRTDSGMVAPAPAGDADCDGFGRYQLTDVAPPEGSAIACVSATELSFVPPWSDACDPKDKLVTMYDDGMGDSGSFNEPPAWWPCDEDGNFIPSPHFTAAQPQ
jgi:hypothetical protein